MRNRATFGASVVALAVIGATASSGASAATFTFAGSEQTFPVPAGVTGVHVVAVGARGVTCCGDVSPNPGGLGAMLSADVSVPSGTPTLYVEVGGVGSSASSPAWASGGFNGGGGGPFGGGGASDIRTVSCGSSCASGGSADSLASRLAVAGGGGGASDVAAGGNAGNVDGSGAAGASELSGFGATTSAAGTAANQTSATGYCQAVGDQDGETANDGSLGLGGAGATFLITGPVSSGGGGGLYGGGGGGQCYNSGLTASANAGAGGGGSSGAPGGSNVFVTADSADAAEVVITAPVPTASHVPTLTGGLTVGDVLSEAHAAWSSNMQLTSYAYQWERCDATGELASCSAISGAQGQTYTLTTADLGDTLRVQETAGNFYGTGAASSSDPSGVIGEPPTSTSLPAISGTPTQGQVLIEAHASWTQAPLTGYVYQWERCNTAGASCASIVGAVNQAYTLTAADVGSTIKVQENALNAYGTSASATSAATSAVEAATPPSVSIAGPRNVVVGRSAHFGAAVTDSQGTPKSYRWMIGGQIVGTTSTLDHAFSSTGTQTIELALTDTAGNSFSTSATVLVSPAPPRGRINATMTWAFVISKRAVAIQQLSVHRAPVGGRVIVVCAGGGCPRTRTIAVVAPRCKSTRTKKCRKPPAAVNLALAGNLRKRRLARSARLTVRIVRPGYVGKVYVFSMRQPGTPSISCLAPGSTTPGKGC